MHRNGISKTESMRFLSHSTLSTYIGVSFFDTEELGTPGSKLTRTNSYPEHNVRTDRLLI